MGNRSCRNWKSMLFPEETEDEESWIKWLEVPTNLNGKILPAFPGTQLLPVQPIYKPEVGTIEIKRENAQQRDKDKSRRIKTIVYYSKEKRNLDRIPIRGRRIQHRKAPESESTNSESENGGRGYVRIENNNAEHWNNEILPTRQHTDEEIPYTEQIKRGFPTGRVYVSLSHDSTTHRLKVTLLKAKNLSCKRTDGKDKCGINCSDSYIKVTLRDDDKELQSHTTAVKKGYSEVLYYENHAFDIENLDLRALSLDITATHRCKPHLITHDHTIGTVVIHGEMGDDSIVDSQLVEAITHPGQVIYEWHTIRS